MEPHVKNTTSSMNEKKVVAIITARGGSKRIPKKNIKSFLGKPIISYSIEAARNSKCFDEVMVSTDSDEIAAIAEQYGAVIPFMRSEKTSDDYSTTFEVIEEVLKEYNKNGVDYYYGCCIYPTAPFVTPEKLDKAFKLLVESKADSLVPITKFSYPIFRSFKIEKDMLKMNWPEYLNSRSQDLPPAYHDCGQFYFFKTESILKKKKLFTDFTIPFEILETEVQDIDNEVDWKLAEIKYSFLNKNK